MRVDKLLDTDERRYGKGEKKKREAEGEREAEERVCVCVREEGERQKEIFMSQLTGHPKLMMLQLPLPFEEAWSDEQIAVALRVYLTALVTVIEGQTERGDHVTTPKKSRIFENLALQYSTLYGMSTNHAIREMCNADGTEEEKNLLEEELQAKISETTHLPNLVKVIALEKFQASRDLLTMVYIESTVVALLGLENVSDFVQMCLNKQT